jgi:protein TonB
VNGVRVPLALSLAGHAAFLAALVLLATVPPHRPTIPALHGIQLILAPPAPKPTPAPRPPHRTAPASPPAPPKPAVVRPPPRPMPPPVMPKPVAKPPPAHPPVIRRTVRPAPHRVRRRPEIRRRPWRYAPPEAIAPRYVPPPPEPAMPRYMPMPPERFPAPAPAPRPAAPARTATVTPGYRALLSEWLEAHKYYPETARERGEEGLVLLRFRIDRSGRVLDCTVARSSGYADLDNAAVEMMRGAVLPPFPPSMPEQSLEIAVPIRFGLR